MASDGFLQKEQELMKLNAELNIRTKSILHKTSERVPPSQLAKKIIPSWKKINTNSDRRNGETNQIIDAKKLTINRKLMGGEDFKENTIERNYKKNNDPAESDEGQTMSSLESNKIVKEMIDFNDNGNQSPAQSSHRHHNHCPHCHQHQKVQQEVSSSSRMRTNPKQGSCCVIPERILKKNISSDGLIKFLKAKVSILQDEIETVQKDNFKKSEELNNSLEVQKQLTSQKEQLSSKNNSLQEQVKKLEEKNIDLDTKLKDKENELSRLTKELDTTKRDVKSLTQSNNSLERRLLKNQEEIENIKNTLNNASEREKETRDRSRQEKDAFERQMKQLRKQRLELITAYKHQLLLLDNLKRQNLCLEEAKMVEFSEKEFTKILDWKK